MNVAHIEEQAVDILRRARARINRPGKWNRVMPLALAADSLFGKRGP